MTTTIHNNPGAHCHACMDAGGEGGKMKSISTIIRITNPRYNGAGELYGLADVQHWCEHHGVYMRPALPLIHIVLEGMTMGYCTAAEKEFKARLSQYQTFEEENRLVDR